MRSCRNISMLAVLTMGFLLACNAWGAPPEATSKPATKSWDEALNDRIPKVEYNGNELGDVVQYFRDISGRNMVVNWNALASVGLDKSKPVTIQLKDVPLAVALKAALNSVEGPNPLDYAVIDDILTISTAEDLNAKTITQVYDVSDLIDCSDPEQVKSLIALVRQNVDWNSWVENAGTIGTVTHLRGTLTVTQTYRAQVALQKLLEDLRKAGTKASYAPAAQARQAEIRVKLVGNMKDTCFDPRAMGIVAVGGLRSEVPEKPEELAKQLEGILPQTKALGLRNAIRLTLKDLYLETGAAAKAQAQLKEMVRENDEALQKTPGSAVSVGSTAPGRDGR